MLPLSSVVAPKPHRAPSPRDHNGNLISKSHSSNSRPQKAKHKFSQSHAITNIGNNNNNNNNGGGVGSGNVAQGGHRFSGTSGMGAPSLPIAITNNWQKTSPQLRGNNGGSATVGSPRVSSPSSPSFATAMLSGSPQQAAFLRSMMSAGMRRESVDEHELAAREIMGIMHNNNTQPVNIPAMRGINARAPSTPLPPINRSSFLTQIQQSNGSVGLFFSHASSAFSQAAPILINKNTINNNNNHNYNNNTSSINNNYNMFNQTNTSPSVSHTNANAMVVLSQSPTTSSMTLSALGTSPSLAAMSPPMRSANPVIRDDRFHFEREGGGSGLGLGLGLGGGMSAGLANEMDAMAALRLDDPHGMPRVDGDIDDAIDDSDDQIDPVSVSMSAESDTLII